MILLFPLYWMVSGSFKDVHGVMQMPPDWIPKNATLANYTRLFDSVEMARLIGNTALVAIGGVCGSLLFASLAGYALTFYTFRGKQIVHWAFLIALMVPWMSLLIPTFLVMRKLGLSRSAMGAIVPLWYNPIGVLLFRNYAETLPTAIDDAARIDGAGELQILARITIPLCKPVLGVMAIFAFFRAYGDYLWQSLILRRPEQQTLIVGLIQAIERRGGGSPINLNPIGMYLAAGTLLFLAPFLTFCIFQRTFRSGITAGAIKE